jgi:hypothetical protein
VSVGARACCHRGLCVWRCSAQPPADSPGAATGLRAGGRDAACDRLSAGVVGPAGAARAARGAGGCRALAHRPRGRHAGVAPAPPRPGPAAAAGGAAGARGRRAGARGGPRHAASRVGLPGRRQRPPGSARARVSEGAAVRQPPACVAVAQRRRARAAGAVAAAAPAVPAPAGLAVASARTVPGRPALLRRRARRAARAARVGRRARHRARVRRHPPCAGAGAGLARARRCEPAAPLRPPPAAARDRAARTVRGAERELAAAPALAGVAGARECRHRDRAPRTSSSRP